MAILLTSTLGGSGWLFSGFGRLTLGNNPTGRIEKGVVVSSHPWSENFEMKYLYYLGNRKTSPQSTTALTELS